jgi:WD40 repeat protein
MKSSILFISLLLNINCLAQKESIYISKFTNINPISYTDVVYTASKDTVLISTYSGRIARIIKNQSKEIVVANIDDEIYSLNYSKQKKQIIASTLSKGILLVNELTGKIVRTIPIPSSWSNSVVCSEDLRYITALDQKGNRYLFDANKNYKNIGNDTLIPSGRIAAIDSNYIATIVTSKKVTLWSLIERKEIKSWSVELERFGDMDYAGGFLSINFNECTKYDALIKAASVKIMHPNWPLANPDNPAETFDIPLQLQINAAKFVKGFIYTGSIDRSVRVWDKNSGQLITTLYGHKGSITKIKVNTSQTQVVSVDLKGVIKFWEVMK